MPCGLRRLSPMFNRIGATMKIEELVASTKPNRRAIANYRKAGPPKSASGAMARNRAADVPMVRASASLRLMLMWIRSDGTRPHSHLGKLGHVLFPIAKAAMISVADAICA